MMKFWVKLAKSILFTCAKLRRILPELVSQEGCETVGNEQFDRFPSGKTVQKHLDHLADKRDDMPSLEGK